MDTDDQWRIDWYLKWIAIDFHRNRKKNMINQEYHIQLSILMISRWIIIIDSYTFVFSLVVLFVYIFFYFALASSSIQGLDYIISGEKYRVISTSERASEREKERKKSVAEYEKFNC